MWLRVKISSERCATIKKSVHHMQCNNIEITIYIVMNN
jgi:hypothetical protein